MGWSLEGSVPVVIRRCVLATTGLLLITPIPAKAAPTLCGDTITVDYAAQGAESGSDSFTACSNIVSFVGILGSGQSGFDVYYFDVSASSNSIILSISSFDESEGGLYEMPSFVNLSLTGINWFGMPGVTIQSVIDNSPYFDVAFGPDSLTLTTIPGGIPDQAPGGTGGSVTLPLGSFTLQPSAVVAVPEPSTMALLAFGLAGVASRRRSLRIGGRSESPERG